MAASDVGNGTTLSFNNTPIGKLTNLEPDKSRKEVDCTTLEDDEDGVEVGTSAGSLTFEVIGALNLTPGAKGDIVITYPDATTDSLGHMVLTGCKKNVRVNQPITTSVTLRKTRADGS